MHQYDITLVNEAEEEFRCVVDAMTPSDAVNIAIDECGPYGLRPIAVDDLDIVGQCESCRKWLVERDEMYLDWAKKRTCGDCFDVLQGLDNCQRENFGGVIEGTR